jgi:hypothetical protein
VCVIGSCRPAFTARDRGLERRSRRECRHLHADRAAFSIAGTSIRCHPVQPM